MAAARKDHVDRIRKLIALSSNPNAHEGDSARAEAERLMAKHGLTLADFEEDVIELADDRADEERLRLAKAIGTSRRCVGLVGKSGEIAFRGRPAAAKAARELYQALVTDASRNCNIGPNDPGRDTWRICFWIGFADTIVARLLEDEVSAWTPPERHKKKGANGATAAERAAAAAVPSTEVALRSATADFAAHCSPMFAQMSIDSVRQEGYAAGENFGRSRHVPARDKAPSTDRALGPGKEKRS